MQQDVNDKTAEKKRSWVKRIFVHNIGWKLLSVAAAAVMWALSAGLL